MKHIFQSHRTVPEKQQGRGKNWLWVENPQLGLTSAASPFEVLVSCFFPLLKWNQLKSHLVLVYCTNQVIWHNRIYLQIANSYKNIENCFSVYVYESYNQNSPKINYLTSKLPRSSFSLLPSLFRLSLSHCLGSPWRRSLWTGPVLIPHSLLKGRCLLYCQSHCVIRHP